MQLVGATTRASPPPVAHRRDRVQRRSHQRTVVGVSAGQDEIERRAARVGDEVTLGGCLALVRRVRAGGRPLFSPARSRCRRSPGSSRSRPPRAGVRAILYARVATLRPVATRAVGASSSCRSRTSSRPAASPRRCPSAAGQDRCRSGRPDRSRGRRPSGEAGAAVEAGRLQFRDRRGEAGEPYHPNAQPTRSCRPVRRSKTRRKGADLSVMRLQLLG